MAKKRGSKALFPKRMAADYVNVHRRVNPDVMKTYQETVLSVTGPKNNKLPVSNNTFTQPIPQTIGTLKSRDGYNGVKFWQPEHIFEVTQKLEQRAVVTEQGRVFQAWQGVRQQGVIEFNHVKFSPTLKLFFSGERYYWLEEQYGLVSISVLYRGKEKALDAQKRGKILWKVFTETTKPET
jgi:hypothetical protein